MRDCPNPIRSTPGFFTALVVEKRIELLCRSADWYLLPPIQRYLYNMAASSIRMEDAITETRVYTFDRYNALQRLVGRSFDDKWNAAFEAWILWGEKELTFGVVHLETAAGKRGDLILGDDPSHFAEWAPDDEVFHDDLIVAFRFPGLRGRELPGGA